jgi:acyl-CoA synthetase (NDP forming)
LNDALEVLYHAVVSFAPDLSRLLDARSIAVVGASADPLKIGGRPIEYLRRFGFTGRIVPVNPHRAEVQGLRCLKDLRESEPVDVAIIAAPGEGAPQAVEQSIAAGAKSIILFTAGFAEVDERGLGLQRELAGRATAAGVTLLGPNCLGVINAHSRVVATFTTALETGQLPSGGFSYVGQSGALGAYWLEKAVSAGLGISKWVTTGNEAQTSLADALSYLADDRETQVIGLYIEDVKNPALFAASAARARRAGKPVLAIKAGRSEAGRRAVGAHTGAIAGDDASYQSLLDECRITRVASLTEMVDVARLLLAPHPPASVKRLNVVTVSGGAGVLICDAAQDAGLCIPELPDRVRAELDGILPAFVRRQNPIDVTGAIVSNPGMLDRILIALSANETCDAIVLFVGLMNSIGEDIVAAIQKARTRGKPILVIWMGASETSRGTLERAGIPVMTEIPAAIIALAKASSGGHRADPSR